MNKLKVKIEQAITKYFGTDQLPGWATKIHIFSLDPPSQSQARLNQAIMLNFEQGGREVYVLVPFDIKVSQTNWLVIPEYVRQHPEAKLLLWLNGQIKEL